MVLIATLAAVAAPSFAGFWRASQVRNCAWQVAALAGRARDYAICHSVRVALEYREAEQQFRLTAENDPINAADTWEPLRLAGAQPVAVPDGVEQVALSVEGRDAGADWPVVFFPDGQALAADIVLLQSRGALTVTVAPLTGRAKVVEGDAREEQE